MSNGDRMTGSSHRGTAPSNRVNERRPRQPRSPERVWEETHPSGRVYRFSHPGIKAILLWNFAVDDDEMKPEHRNKLNEWLRDNASILIHERRPIVVSGKASRTGREENNLNLSQRRAINTGRFIFNHPSFSRNPVYGDFDPRSLLKWSRQGSSNQINLSWMTAMENLGFNRSVLVTQSPGCNQPLSNSAASQIAQHYLEQQLGLAIPDISNFWTPTVSAMDALIPIIPAPFFSNAPRHWGSRVPPRGFSYRQPGSSTIFSFYPKAEILLLDLDLHFHCSSETVHNVVSDFLQTGRRAISKMNRRLQALSAQLEAGAAVGVDVPLEELDRFRELYRSMKRDRTCLLHYL